MLNLLDDTPIVPGDAHPVFENVEAGREILNVAEDLLRNWQPNLEPIHSNAGSLGVGAMPGGGLTGNERQYGSSEVGREASVNEHSAYREKGTRSRSTSGERRVASGGSLGTHGGGGEVQPPYPMTDAERREVEQAGVI